MTKVLAVNSFRSGAGSTHIAANLATLLAQAGCRVGLIDADLRAPSLHFLIDMASGEMDGSLNDFLIGKSGLHEVQLPLPPAPLVEPSPPGSAQDGFDHDLPEPPTLYFVPAEDAPQRYVETARPAYDIERLREGFHHLSERLALDFLVIDTSAGIGQETLTALAHCDQLLIVLTLDRRELQGSSVTVDAAKKLHIAETRIVVNKATTDYDRNEIRRQISERFNCGVAAILPYSDEIAGLESRALFTQCFPEHAATS